MTISVNDVYCIELPYTVDDNGTVHISDGAFNRTLQIRAYKVQEQTGAEEIVSANVKVTTDKGQTLTGTTGYQLANFTFEGESASIECTYSGETLRRSVYFTGAQREEYLEFRFRYPYTTPTQIIPTTTPTPTTPQPMFELWQILFIIFTVSGLIILGALLISKKPSKTESETKQTTIPTNSKKEYCYYCGAMMPIGSNFCKKCGKKQD